MFKLEDQRSADAAPHTPAANHTPEGVPGAGADGVGADGVGAAGAAGRRTHESPHEASRFDAGTGQGTVSKLPGGKTLDHPVLDGATESGEAQRATLNPYRGRRDPALGEWNYSHDHAHEHELEYEPERRLERDADAAAHAGDIEPRHWYKYDPFREQRNRQKRAGGEGGAGPTKAM